MTEAKIYIDNLLVFTSTLDNLKQAFLLSPLTLFTFHRYGNRNSEHVRKLFSGGVQISINQGRWQLELLNSIFITYCKCLKILIRRT